MGADYSNNGFQVESRPADLYDFILVQHEDQLYICVNIKYIRPKHVFQMDQAFQKMEPAAEPEHLAQVNTMKR